MLLSRILKLNKQTTPPQSYRCTFEMPLHDASPTGRITAIEFAPEGTYRTRRIVTRSRARPTGKYPSWKLGRMVQWESPHERNAFKLLDANPDVLIYGEQPLQINYVLNGENEKHRPDILVKTKAGLEIWEVKPSYYAFQKHIRERTALLTDLLPQYGYQYKLALAEEITDTVELDNAETLLKFGREDIPFQDREILRLLLAQVSVITWGTVLDGALGPSGRHYICRLILEGKLAFNKKEPLERTSLLMQTTLST